MLRRQADASDAGEAGPEIEGAIEGARGRGQPLDRGVQAQMEQAFGADFGGVRVHTGAQADTLNRALSARAFTTGQDIFFRDGEYRPGSSSGQELLAHELTHVVQQSGGVQTKLTVGPPNDIYEQEADQVASSVVRKLQRQADDEDEKPLMTKRDAGANAGAGRVQANSEEDMLGNICGPGCGCAACSGGQASIQRKPFERPAGNTDEQTVEPLTRYGMHLGYQANLAPASAPVANTASNAGSPPIRRQLGRGGRAAVGALAGGALGAGVGALVGGPVGAGVGALVGAGLGALVGALTAPNGPPAPVAGNARTVDVQPVFFKSSAADAAPTGGSWAGRLAQSNTIWGKLGVTFNALATVTLVDAARKTAGADLAEYHNVRAARNGAGVEVFMVDNDINFLGGGGTVQGGTANAQIVLSDRGTSNTLLAHELGHVLGLGHPPGGGDANTIMTPTGSHSAANPTRNTIGNYNRITWPAPGAATNITPDP